MKIRGIAADVLDLLLRLGEESHPYEFAAILTEEDGVITGVDLVPGTVGTEESAHVLLDMLPLGIHNAGSAHSHPNGVLLPSDADLRFFPRTGGRYHLIIGAPYGPSDWACFTADGTPHDLAVIG
ncbi:Mov34/MPN/PAD-1 family protein [Methanofollis fontis]|uniref:Proteasome protein n=1 Tax=Methanofollis fontis TaxID=2052832 RepID=A0A483CZP0_9EURY|nr:Mov34/MPN/PAD-1 family protein [Methanofollis fontis]TAJ45609.1 proteasome protein [Methanofollis fontis]